jgi:LysM repeat protein
MNHDDDLERLISTSLAARSDAVEAATGSIDDVHRRVDLRRGRRRHVAAFGATTMLAVGAFALTTFGSSDPTIVPLAAPNSDIGSLPDMQEVWRCTGPVAPTDDQGVSYFAHCEQASIDRTVDGTAPMTSLALLPTTTIACPVPATDTPVTTVPCTWGPPPTVIVECSPRSRPADVTVPCGTAPRLQEATHRVQAGETLASISEAYGIPIEEIIALNPWGGSSEVTLVEGETIVIALTPIAPATTVPTDLTVTATTLPAQPSSGVARYTIRDGDTIVSLANTFNVSVEAIVEANSTVANGDATLRSGDTIHVPRNAYMTDVPADAFVSAREQPYRVAQDDSVISIAEQFGFLPETLAAYNQWADGLGHVLLVDDEILVPPGGVIVEE